MLSSDPLSDFQVVILTTCFTRSAVLFFALVFLTKIISKPVWRKVAARCASSLSMFRSRAAALMPRSLCWWPFLRPSERLSSQIATAVSLALFSASRTHSDTCSDRSPTFSFSAASGIENVPFGPFYISLTGRPFFIFAIRAAAIAR